MKIHSRCFASRYPKSYSFLLVSLFQTQQSSLELEIKKLPEANEALGVRYFIDQHIVSIFYERLHGVASDPPCGYFFTAYPKNYLETRKNR